MPAGRCRAVSLSAILLLGYITVHLKSEKPNYVHMLVLCWHMKRSILIRIFTHWVTVFISKELHNVHLHSCTVKWNAIFPKAHSQNQVLVEANNGLTSMRNHNTQYHKPQYSKL